MARHTYAGDILRHASSSLNFLNNLQGLVGQFVGQRFHHVTSTKRIGNMGHSRFFLENELCISSNPCGMFRRQAYRFIVRVGVQTLCATEYRRHGLDGGADDIVHGLCLRQGVT